MTENHGQQASVWIGGSILGGGGGIRRLFHCQLFSFPSGKVMFSQESVCQPGAGDCLVRGGWVSGQEGSPQCWGSLFVGR